MSGYAIIGATVAIIIVVYLIMRKASDGFEE